MIPAHRSAHKTLAICWNKLIDWLANHIQPNIPHWLCNINNSSRAHFEKILIDFSQPFVRRLARIDSAERPALRPAMWHNSQAIIIATRTVVLWAAKGTPMPPFANKLNRSALFGDLSPIKTLHAIRTLVRPKRQTQRAAIVFVCFVCHQSSV